MNKYMSDWEKMQGTFLLNTGFYSYLITEYLCNIRRMISIYSTYDLARQLIKISEKALIVMIEK